MFLAARRKERDNYTYLGLTALASSGDGATINKELEEMEKFQ